MYHIRIVNVCINALQVLVNSVGGNGSSPIKQLTELMSQERTELDETPEYVHIYMLLYT